MMVAVALVVEVMVAVVEEMAVVVVS